MIWVAAYFVWMVVVLAALAAGTYLVLQGHPWFGLLAFMIAGSTGFRSKSEKDE